MEIITAGLHHIVTTQGMNPLTEEALPTIMTSIEQSTIQGEEIPLSYLPAEVINATTDEL